jgi:hypothetical protein
MFLKRVTSRSVVKASLIIILSAVGIWLLYFCVEGLLLDYFNNKVYQAAYLPTSGYAKELNLSALDYEEIQKEYSRPASIVREESAVNPDVMLVCNEYPGVSVYYSEVTEFSGAITRYVYLISITGKEYRFGSLDIGIGSTRMQVRIAYLLDQKIESDELANSAEHFPGVDEGFYGDGWSRILFCYDDAGIVTSMAYEPPSF